LTLFTLSRSAEEDLIQIYVEGATAFGLQQAQRYHQRLFRMFQFLAENPQAAPARHELSPSSGLPMGKPVTISGIGGHLRRNAQVRRSAPKH